MSYTKEIHMIEQYLIKKNIGLDNLNIKIVFSIMKGYGINDTSPLDLVSYNNLCNVKYLKNAISSYTVLSRSYINQKPTCLLSKSVQEQSKKSWQRKHIFNKNNRNIKPKLFDDFDDNKNAYICLNCLKCYNMSQQIQSEVVEEF